MDFIVNERIKDSITVKELIVLLMNENMEHEVYFSKDDIRLRGVSVMVKEKTKPRELGCLFG